MIKKIRTSVFETNSSSVHSLVLQTEKEFNDSYFWEDYMCISYDEIKKLHPDLDNREFEEWFEQVLMSDKELEEVGEYDFDLSDDDDYYYRVFPAKWVVKNYNNCDLEVKNKNNMVAVSIYIYE